MTMAGGRRPRYSTGISASSMSPALLHEIIRLNALRRGLHCSQHDLAHMIGVSQSSLSRFFRLPYLQSQRPHFLASTEGLARIDLALKLFVPRVALPRAPIRLPLRSRNVPAPAAREALLPASPSHQTGTAATKTPKAAAPTQRTDYRILIAEDDADTLDLYTTLFRDEEHRLKYEVTVATTVGECLRRLRIGASHLTGYDLLMMDLNLGDYRNAAEKSLLGQLLRRPRWLPEHLLVVSGVSRYALRSKIGDLEKLHAFFIPKPFDIEVLLDAVHALVTGHKPDPGYTEQF
jgi:CheY-like chemotaxis protein